jgi:hypothetical protein
VVEVEVSPVVVVELELLEDVVGALVVEELAVEERPEPDEEMLNCGE